MFALHLPLFPESDIIIASTYLQSETEAKCFAHLSLHLPEYD